MAMALNSVFWLQITSSLHKFETRWQIPLLVMNGSQMHDSFCISGIIRLGFRKTGYGLRHHCTFTEETSSDTNLRQIPRVLQTLAFEHQQFGVCWMFSKDLFGQSEGFFVFFAFDEQTAHS